MKRYQPSTFRPVFGVAAAALSAVTLAVSVILPMGLATGCPACPDDATIAMSPSAVTVSIVPAHLDVFATPVRTVSLEPVNVVGRRSQAG
jgi:hypothetical protein